MSKISVNQTGKDGVGYPKTVIAETITLKAKEVQTLREGTIKITGLKSGTSYTIQLFVNQGDKSLPYGAPPLDFSNSPVASFTQQIDNSSNNEDNFNQQINPAYDGIDDGVLNMEK